MSKRGQNKKRSAKEVEHQRFTIYSTCAGTTHTERLRHVAAEEGILIATLYNYSRKYKWKDRLKQLQAVENEERLAEIEAKADAKRLENGVAVGKVSFEKIGELMKHLGYQGLLITDRLARVYMNSMNFWITKAEELLLMQNTGKLLTHLEQSELTLALAKIEAYEEKIREYIKPNAVAKYLQVAGIEGAINNIPEDIETAAFTPAALLQAMEQNTPGTNIGDPKYWEGLEDMFKEGLPEIDARKVKDEVNEDASAGVVDINSYNIGDNRKAKAAGDAKG